MTSRVSSGHIKRHEKDVPNAFERPLGDAKGGDIGTTGTNSEVEFTSDTSAATFDRNRIRRKLTNFDVPPMNVE